MSGFLSAGSFCCGSWLFALCSCSCIVLATVGRFSQASGSDSCRIWRTVRSLIEGASKTNFFAEIFLTFSHSTCTSKSLSSIRWSLVGFNNTSGSFVISTSSIGCLCICSCSCTRFIVCLLRVEVCLFFEGRGRFMGPLLSLTKKSMAISPLSCGMLWVVLCEFLSVVSWLFNTWLGSLTTSILSGACTPLAVFQVRLSFVELLVIYSTICMTRLSSSDLI